MHLELNRSFLGDRCDFCTERHEKAPSQPEAVDRYFSWAAKPNVRPCLPQHLPALTSHSITFRK